MDTDRRIDAVTGALRALGIGGAALALVAVAALPALADDHGGGSGTDNGRHTGAARAGAPPEGASSTGHNPPGNNGTVFIHDTAGDTSPHNVPHVTCNFYVDFFGFDAGQSASVSFAGQAPTGKGTALGGSWSGVVSTDDAGGAGNDYDMELAFTADQLGVTALGPPAHQGYHVTMTVLTNQPDANPTGKKSKVFWLQPCATAPAAAPTAQQNTPTSIDTETAPAATSGAEGPLAVSVGAFSPGGLSSGGLSSRAGQATGAAGMQQPTTSRTSEIPTTVLGRSVQRAPSASAAATSSSLPFTGAEIGGLVAAAAAALGGGIALAVAGRRRRSRRVIPAS